MDQYKVLTIFLTIQIYLSTAIEILYVLPDNLTNDISCPSQPCTTLNQYLLDNRTLPVVSNVEYHFLPGEHHVPVNMILQNLQNFSIIGTVSKPSPLAVLVLVDCPQSYIINITDSYNVTIANVMLQQCDSLQLTNVLITLCYSCTIENVVFMNVGLIATNLIGRSYLTDLEIKSNKKLPMFCQKIELKYWNQQSFTDHNHLLVMNQINMIGNRKKCFRNGPVGLHINIIVMESLTIILINSLFYNLDHTALTIISQCRGYNNVSIENCTFEDNYIVSYEEFDPTLRPLIDIISAHDNKSISFKQCKFKGNHHVDIFIKILIKATKQCYDRTTRYSCINPVTNITFVACQFTKNVVSELMNIYARYCEVNLLIIGPTQFTKTICGTLKNKQYDVISIYKMTVNIIGPVVISSNHAHTIMLLQHCDVTFYNNITYKSNDGMQIIYLKFSWIKIMENANITLLRNRYQFQLITNINYILNPHCLFQFVTLKNTTSVSPAQYSINIVNNTCLPKRAPKLKEVCLFILYHFTPHCKWMPTAAFHGYSPKIIYQQIIKTSSPKFTYQICHCTHNGSNNCSVDTLGPVYPGQMLPVELCTPFNEELSTLYAEVNSIHLPTSACKVAPQTEIIYTISNYSKNFTFIIVSEATDVCELFLAAASDTQTITEAFYVQLLPCPVGFTLQSGVCDCDPVLSSYIDECYIDYSAIRRPANAWIYVHTQDYNNKYLISDCPMDYCLPYSTNINFLHPDLQCQFNRTGILCSQCQQHLSMVFGSSRCMKCTNLHILITIIVIVAGIILVLLLYLLNLTVTTGTINGIIFYANIVSINDSVFLINNDVFKPLRVFISFTNLDLGIETCFYNGMDSYTKMWLQLFFPFYLIIIAVSIIVASRYSSRILRLTYTRSLPVLATLFLLSYTGVLRTVLTALFSYSTITHLPSGHKQIVWSIDASVPLFGLKFTILFITCLVLFLLLIPFNITLLFTRHLLRFRMVYRFKPLLDAFQGSYKDRYYYWVAVHLTMRSLLFTMYGFQTSLKLILSTMFLMIFSIYNGRIYPYKNKLVNIQELLLLINLTIMYAVSYQSNESIFSIVTNVMISLAFIQFCTIVLYHFLTYTCHCNVEIILQASKENLVKFCYINHTRNNRYFNVALLNIPECTYNYTEYQDGLTSEDFK